MDKPLRHDWEALEMSGFSARAGRLDRPGAAAEFMALGEDLHRHIVRLNPSWPSEEETAEKFAALIQLKERIDLAGRRWLERDAPEIPAV